MPPSKAVSEALPIEGKVTEGQRGSLIDGINQTK